MKEKEIYKGGHKGGTNNITTIGTHLHKILLSTTAAIERTLKRRLK